MSRGDHTIILRSLDIKVVLVASRAPSQVLVSPDGKRAVLRALLSEKRGASVTFILENLRPKAPNT